MPKTYYCPFFKWNERNRLHCEGGCLAFPDAVAKNEFIDRYCAALPGWESCPISRYVSGGYERKENEDYKH